MQGQWEMALPLLPRQTTLLLSTTTPQANFDTALPDTTSNSLTVGTGYSFNKNTNIDFSYAAMFYDKRKIDNDVGATSGASIDGKYSTFCNVYMVTLTFKI
jgi:long-subunit fatty acid transport protein